MCEVWVKYDIIDRIAQSTTYPSPQYNKPYPQSTACPPLGFPPPRVSCKVSQSWRPNLLLLVYNVILWLISYFWLTWAPIHWNAGCGWGGGEGGKWLEWKNVQKRELAVFYADGAPAASPSPRRTDDCAKFQKTEYPVFSARLDIGYK